MSKFVNPKVKVFISWGIANIIGFTTLGLLGIFLIDQHSLLDDPILGTVLPIVIMTLPLGLAQWLILWRNFRISPLWVISITFGWLILELSQVNVPDFLFMDEVIIEDTILITIWGAASGFPQWVLLSNRIEHSWLWILASALGLGLGVGIADFISQTVDSGAVIIIPLFVYMFLTGIILITRMTRTSRESQ